MIEWNGRRAARAGQLRDLLHDCVASPASGQAACIVEAAHLLLGAADVAVVEAMVACGAYESAAYVVLGPERPFLLSRGVTGVCLASTLVATGGKTNTRDQATMRDEATGEAATPALAMLAALAAALLAEENRGGMPLDVSAPSSHARLH